MRSTVHRMKKRKKKIEISVLLPKTVRGHSQSTHAKKIRKGVVDNVLHTFSKKKSFLECERERPKTHHFL